MVTAPSDTTSSVPQCSKTTTTEVEGYAGGQILHGENKHTLADKAAQEQEAQQGRQTRLNDLLAAFREQLFPYRDQIQPMFAEYDTHGDGHCESEKFAEMLTQIGVELDNSDMELIMESFFDPDVEDQTRPMSIAVLDEALFG